MRTHSRQQRAAKRKRRIQYRLRKRQPKSQAAPVFTASNIHYDVAERTRGLGVGGIGVIHRLARQSGLIEAIDERLKLLKIHLPYHESDHVLNMAYNLIVGGTCLQDLELLRNDEVYLDALGAQRIPDPTTAGDFCRRFTEADVAALQEAIDEARLRVWQQQDESFFEEAILEADGTLVSTTAECKQGLEISYNGEWGYQTLVVSLANTREPLRLMNRSGNRPSHEGAAAQVDEALELCVRAGFKRILLRGDTDFTQTAHLDRWDQAGNVRFIFGMDAAPNLKQIAANLPDSAWQQLARPAKYQVKTRPRRRPENVKEKVIVARKFKNIRLRSEEVAEFDYRPTKCRKTYRMVVLRKNLSVYKGEELLSDEIRYFFYITNDRRSGADEIVYLANDRCEQENLIEQLKNGVRALRLPVDNLVSNCAYMVMASLAWTLKAWFALSLPAKGRWAAKHRAEKDLVLRMEFKQFVNLFMRVPCQLVRTGRRLVYRLLSWNPFQAILLRVAAALRC